MLLCLALLPVVAEGTTNRVLLKHQANNVWWTPEGSPISIYMADRGGEPQMVLDAGAMMREPLVFDIRSDAKQYQLQAGSQTYDIPAAPNDRDRISLDASGDQPLIKINDQALADPDGQFAKLMKGTGASITLKLAQATRVAVSVLVDGRLAPLAFRAAAVDLEPTLPGLRDTRPKTKTDTMVVAARKSVFPVRIRTTVGGVYLKTTAFFVTPDGFAVCRFHPLKNAHEAWALLPGLADPVEMVPYVVRPQLDLALLKLDTSKLPLNYKLAWLPIVEEKDPVEGKAIVQGNETWALGFGQYGDPTVAAGAVAEKKPWTKLPIEVQPALPYDNLSHWIIHTSQVSLDNSGGPLVNVKGELIGVNTWIWPQPQRRSSSRSRSRSSSRGNAPVPDRVNYALHAQHVRDMIEPKPTVAMDFEQMRAHFGNRRVPHNSLPRAEVQQTGFGLSAHLRLAAGNFQRGTICPLCKGEGKILDAQKVLEKRNEEKRQAAEEARNRQTLGGRLRGRVTPRPQEKKDEEAEREELMKACPRCEETGLQHADSVFRLGRNTVMALAALDHTDFKNQEAKVFMEERLLDLMESNPQSLARTLNAQARRHLHTTALQQGTPVMLMGVADTQTQLTSGTSRSVTVQVGEFGPNVVVVEPDVATLKPDGIVMVGGILVGYLDDVEGKPMPLIHGGFIVNIPESQEAGPGQSNGRPGTSSSHTSSSARSQNSSRADAWRRWMEARGRGGYSRRGR